MSAFADIDWQTMFLPSTSPIELVIRGTFMYLGILVALRVFRRETGALSTADLLVVILVADAAQNGMSSEYRSITEGVVLVGTIVGWSYVLDWLGYRYRWMQRLLHAPPLLLIWQGKLNHRHLRAEMLTVDDLKARLREQGIESFGEVKRCYIESDGQISFVRRRPDDRQQQAPAGKLESSGGR